MKTVIICLILLLPVCTGFSQYLLGLDEVRVKEKAREFGNNQNLTFKKTWYQNKAYGLSWYDDQIECKVMVAFNPYTNLSVVTTLIPDDTEVLNALKKGFEDMQFNRGKDYWIARIGGKVLKIEEMPYNGAVILVFRGITPQEMED
jgi:hypothetical protein